MIFYHHTKRENVKAILSEGLKLSRAIASPLFPTRIFLCINDKDFTDKGICLRVIIPDEKVVCPSHLGMGNFDGQFLKLAEDIPPEWIELIDSNMEQMTADKK